MSIEIDAIPSYLKSRTQWINWKYEQRGKKFTKAPHQPNGSFAKTNDASTWSNFEDCVSAISMANFDGIGFAFANGDRLVGIDLDHCFTGNGKLEPWAQQMVDQFPGTYIERSPSGDGLHIWCFGVPVATGSRKWKKSGSDTEQGIEVYNHTSARYFTVTGHVLVSENESNEASHVIECQEALDSIYQDYFFERHDEPKQVRDARNQIDQDLVRQALEVIPSDEYTIWINGGMAIKGAGLPLELFEEWSAKSTKFQPGECERKWASFKKSGIGLGTIFHYAKQNGFRLPRRRHSLDDIGNAQRFVDQFGNVIRWHATSKQWLVWDGRRWQIDKEERVLGFAKIVARQIYSEAADCGDEEESKRIAKHAHQTAAANKLEAMLKLAKPDLAIRADMLDCDQFKLNCANGTIDLKTGELHPHNPKDYITKLVNVAYNPDALAPRYLQFLSETFAGCEATIKFAQAAFGYCLTGSTTEQKLFLLYGAGQNGKTTLLNAVRDILGDYAQETDPGLINAKRNVGGATEDVARLRGIRFATTIETNEGVKLDEARVKQLTGSDRLAARFLYGHTDEFDPSHKLFIVTNHLPHIVSQSHAMWRRIRLIPFNVQVSDQLKDRHLPDKLRLEYEGILTWLVRGCLEWQSEGLPEAPEVESATANYKSEMDNIERFIESRCRCSPPATIQSSVLYRSYHNWCIENAEPELTKQAFHNRLREKGFTPRKTSNFNLWCGLALIQEVSELAM